MREGVSHPQGVCLYSQEPPWDGPSYFGQQGLQPPPEGSILPAELLVVGQHSLQPSLQPLQILLLLPPGLAGRLPVLDHSLLPLQQLCLGYREDQKRNDRGVGEGNYASQLHEEPEGENHISATPKSRRLLIYTEIWNTIFTSQEKTKWLFEKIVLVFIYF